jgi:hypothetical protein
MEKHFDAATRAEAIELANEWWANQKGLTETLRLIFPVGDRSSPTWKVVLHYEEAPRGRAGDPQALRCNNRRPEGSNLKCG